MPSKKKELLPYRVHIIIGKDSSVLLRLSVHPLDLSQKLWRTVILKPYNASKPPGRFFRKHSLCPTSRQVQDRVKNMHFYKFLWMLRLLAQGSYFVYHWLIKSQGQSRFQGDRLKEKLIPSFHGKSGKEFLVDKV